jgi:hypothetical protein
VELVIYGDFNCPFSALASDRAARLEATGRGIVEWRAVEHDLSIPAEGRPVDSAVRAGLEREIAMIRDQLRPGESLLLHPPTVLVNTAALTAAYAALAPEDRSRVRQQIFDAYWRRGIDIRDPAWGGELPVRTTGAATMDRWRTEWESLGSPIVPSMLLPDGHVSRGLGVLTRLADYLEQPAAPAPQGTGMV